MPTRPRRRTASSPTPTTSLVTGYDFFRDDADKIQSYLDAGIGHAGDALLADNNFGVPAADAWTGAQMKTAVTGSRHDLIFMGGHFSANTALAADFQTTMSSTDVANSAANLQNSIVFSAGCHTGYNLLDVDQLTGVTQPLDWAQAFARKGATLDRRHRLPVRRRRAGRVRRADLRRVRPPAASSATRAGLGRQSRSTKSKQIYLASTPDIRVLHAKSILESTLFGLPMLSVTMPTGRDTRRPAQLADRPDTVSGPAARRCGLQAFESDPLSTPTHRLPVLAHGTYLSGAERDRRQRRRAGPAAPESRTSRRPAPSCAASASSAGTTRTRPAPDAADQQRLDADRDAQPAAVHVDVLRPGPDLRGRTTSTRWRRAAARRTSSSCRPSTGAMAPRRRSASTATSTSALLQLEHRNAALAAAPAITNIAGDPGRQRRDLPGDRHRRPERGHPLRLGHLDGRRRRAATTRWQSIDLNPVNDNPNLYTGEMTAPVGARRPATSGSSSRPRTASVSSRSPTTSARTTGSSTRRPRASSPRPRSIARSRRRPSGAYGRHRRASARP